MGLRFKKNNLKGTTVDTTVLKQLYCFYHRCKYILIITGLLIAFQAKSQSEENLLQLGYHEPENKYDSIYYELFKTYRTSDKIKAKHYAQKALYFSDRHSHFLIQAKACRAIGYLYSKNNQSDSANILYHKGIRIGSLHNLPDPLIDLYNDLGLLYQRHDIYDSALHYFVLVYNLADKIKSYKSLAIASYNIGLVYSYLENYDEAIRYIRKTIAIESKLGITEGVNINLINLARVLNEKGLYADAIEQLKKVEINCKKGCDDITLSDLYYGLAYSNLKNGATNKAYDFFTKALTLARKGNDNKQTLANTLYHLSTFAFDRKAYPEALKYLDESEKIAREISHRRLLRDVYHQLSVVYKKTGSTSKAFHYQEMYTQLSDSIFNKGVANNLKNIQLAEQRKQSDHIIKKKDTALKEKVTELFKTDIVAILLLINCILAFLVIYFGYRSFGVQKLHKQKMEDQIIRMVDKHETNQRQLSRHKMELNYLQSRVSRFLRGPVYSLVGLSNISKNVSTIEEAHDYVTKIERICSSEIIGVLDNIVELAGVQSVAIEVTDVDIRIVVKELRLHFKSNLFPILTFSIPEELTTLRTDRDQLVMLIRNAIDYLISSQNVTPVIIEFSQKNDTTIIDIHCDTYSEEVIPHVRLFNLLNAQILALMLKGSTLVDKHDDHTVFKIQIPTDFDTADQQPEKSIGMRK